MALSPKAPFSQFSTLQHGSHWPRQPQPCLPKHRLLNFLLFNTAATGHGSHGLVSQSTAFSIFYSSTRQPLATAATGHGSHGLVSQSTALSIFYSSTRQPLATGTLGHLTCGLSDLRCAKPVRTSKTKVRV